MGATVVEGPNDAVAAMAEQYRLAQQLHRPDMARGQIGGGGDGMPGTRRIVLALEGGTHLADSMAICEYLDETFADPPLIGSTAAERAEVRRLTAWFDRKFDTEVTANLVGEKIMKRFLGLGNPDSAAIRAGLANIHHHLDYIGWLLETRDWLAGERMTLADIAAAKTHE